MWTRALGRVIGSTLLALPLAHGADLANWWPIWTERPTPPPPAERETALGPFYAHKLTEAWDIRAFRPVYTRFDLRRNEEVDHWHVLYPAFNWYQRETGYNWTFMSLFQGYRDDVADITQIRLWPFYFQRTTPNPRENYVALWPLGGTLKDFFGRDRIDFAAWPLYIRTQRDARGEVRYSVPWPFVQILKGEQGGGFGLWPLYGHFYREGDYRDTWALWPLIYHERDHLSDAIPRTRHGFLPFYTWAEGPGYHGGNYLWPFFGYTREYDPKPDYREVRYFWPLVVQGRGEERYVNRVLPFYAWETAPNWRKTWVAWPIWRQEKEDLGAMERLRSQVLFFLYWDERKWAKQGDYSSQLSFLWPLYGYWDGGQGTRQFQLFDPLTVFFRGNEKVRENWTPLFALYRYEDNLEGYRNSFLWNAVVFEKDGNRKDLSVGPLFDMHWGEGAGRWRVLKGLAGREWETASSDWLLLWNRF